jgi:hypothetical protein
MKEDGKLYLLTPEEQQSITSFDFSSKTNDFLFSFSHCFPRKPEWLAVANGSSKFKPLLVATSIKVYRSSICIAHCYLQNKHISKPPPEQETTNVLFLI